MSPIARVLVFDLWTGPILLIFGHDAVLTDDCHIKRRTPPPLEILLNSLK